MSLAGQWQALGSELPAGWSQAELRLEVGTPEQAAEAAALLGPAQPYRPSPTVLRFAAASDGTTVSADLLTRLLRRLDDDRITGTLALAGVTEVLVEVEVLPPTLADSWLRALAELPP